MASEQPLQDAAAPAAGPTRKRLALKPRDPAAAARLEAERQATQSSKNPFGAAKPREAVIAEKLGKTEEEVLKEEVSKEKLHLRLSGVQLDEKREAEGAVKDAEEALEVEEDAGRRAELQAQLEQRRLQLDELMDKFAKATLETALSGGAPRVSQIRQQQLLQQEQAGLSPGGGGFPQRVPNGGGSFGGREFREDGFGGRGGGGGGGGGGRGFVNYQQRGGFADSYQQGAERQGSYGRRAGGGSRLPEWATDDAPADAAFYDAPAATSAFIASGGYQSAVAGPPPAALAPGGAPGGYANGGRGRGGGGRGGAPGGGRGGGNRYGDGGYENNGFAGRGLGGEFEFNEGDVSFGSGQDRF